MTSAALVSPFADRACTEGRPLKDDDRPVEEVQRLEESGESADTAKLYLRKRESAMASIGMLQQASSRMLMSRMPMRIYCDFLPKGAEEFSTVLVSDGSTAASVLFSAAEKFGLPRSEPYMLCMIGDDRGTRSLPHPPAAGARRDEGRSDVGSGLVSGQGHGWECLVSGACVAGPRKPAAGAKRDAGRRILGHSLCSAQGAAAQARFVPTWAVRSRRRGMRMGVRARSAEGGGGRHGRRCRCRRTIPSPRGCPFASLATGSGPTRASRRLWWSVRRWFATYVAQRVARGVHL